jgi:hypothetical protein
LSTLPQPATAQAPPAALAPPPAAGGAARGPDEDLGFTPRGLAPGELAGMKPAMDAVHGFALGASALLVASTRCARLNRLARCAAAC